jgi:hypothetical protein
MNDNINSFIDKLNTNSREMTEDELLSFVDQLEEYAKKDWWFNYQRRGIQQKAFLASQKHRDDFFVKIIHGPNQMGKTFDVLEELLDCLNRTNRFRDWSIEPKLIVVFTNTQKLQTVNIQRALMKYCGTFLRQNLKCPPTLSAGSTGAWNMLQFKNGDAIYFDSFETNIINVEGYTADMVILDEGRDKYHFFEQLMFRAINQRAPIVWTLVPGDTIAIDVYQKLILPNSEIKDSNHWAYNDKPKQNNRVEIILGDEEDFREARSFDESGNYNRERGDKLVDDMLKMLSEDTVNKKIRGIPGGSEGLVYGFQDHHFIPEFDIPKHWRRDFYIDWGDSNEELHKVSQTGSHERKPTPTVCAFYALPPPDEEVILGNGMKVRGSETQPLVFVYKEYYQIGKIRARIHANAIANLFKPKELFQSPAIDMQVDTTTFEEFQDVFFNHGQSYRFRRARNKAKQSKEKGELLGIELMKAYVADAKMFIMNNCINFKSQALNFKYSKVTGKPQTWGDDFMDITRYFLNDKPRWEDPLKLEDSREEANNEDDQYLDPDFEYLRLDLAKGSGLSNYDYESLQDEGIDRGKL